MLWTHVLFLDLILLNSHDSVKSLSLGQVPDFFYPKMDMYSQLVQDGSRVASQRLKKHLNLALMDKFYFNVGIQEEFFLVV